MSDPDPPAEPQDPDEPQGPDEPWPPPLPTRKGLRFPQLRPSDHTSGDDG